MKTFCKKFFKTKDINSDEFSIVIDGKDYKIHFPYPKYGTIDVAFTGRKDGVILIRNTLTMGLKKDAETRAVGSKYSWKTSLKFEPLPYRIRTDMAPSDSDHVVIESLASKGNKSKGGRN